MLPSSIIYAVLPDYTGTYDDDDAVLIWAEAYTDPDLTGTTRHTFSYTCVDLYGDVDAWGDEIMTPSWIFQVPYSSLPCKPCGHCGLVSYRPSDYLCISCRHVLDNTG